MHSGILCCKVYKYILNQIKNKIKLALSIWRKFVRSLKNISIQCGSFRLIYSVQQQEACMPILCMYIISCNKKKYTSSINAQFNTPFNYTHHIYRVPRAQHVCACDGAPTNMSEVHHPHVCHTFASQCSVKFNLCHASHTIHMLIIAIAPKLCISTRSIDLRT